MRLVGRARFLKELRARWRLWISSWRQEESLEAVLQVSDRDRMAGWGDYPGGRRNKTRQGGQGGGWCRNSDKNKTVGWGPSPWTPRSKSRFETQAGRAPLVV